ncbi:MAG TPA: SUMF1/EgtB/PvdO family nonheme iron enzyme [Myxococcaceae bacterium]|jgi:formylglycine-generating enzyme required for sulfatase activity
MKALYRVFISSTYLDNVVRREEVVEAIQRTGQMVPVFMERFSADDRPTVEVCRSRAAECDLFVGIVAHRYGWEPPGQPPGEEKSITWLEYEAAREAGRPCLMFEIHPSVPISPADLEPEPGTREKGRKLERFKAAYKNGDVLPGVFMRHNLGMLVQQALGQWKERQALKPEGLEAELRRYRDGALKEHGTVQLSGTKLRVPIDLEALYVPLGAAMDLRGHGEAAFADARDAKEQLEREGRAQDVSLLDAFRLAVKMKRQGLVLLGEPGSGKTTHLKRLLIHCLKGRPEELGLPAGMVPVFLSLRRLEDPDRETVEHLIERHFNEQLGLSRDFAGRLLERGNLLFLFDGLDEVANPERREKVARWVERVLRAHSSCWPVVTCRFAGYGEQGPGKSSVRLDAEFLELHVRPLEPEQTAELVRKWYLLVETGLNPDYQEAARLAEERAGALIATLKSGDMRTRRVAEMVANPLLLASLCLVHRGHGRLPEDRQRLYGECIDVLLERWQERQGPLASMKPAHARRVLQPVAEWLHQEEERTRASGAELVLVLEPALKVVRWTGGTTQEFLDLVRNESGLLTGWGPDQFGFMHLGFQEYLAASELRRRAAEAGATQEEVLQELARHYGESWWQEVLLLFVAMGNPCLFGPLVREIVKRPTFAQHRELLGLLLEEAAELDARPFVDLVRQEPGRDAELWQRQRVALEALQQMGEREALLDLAKALRSHPSQEIQASLGAVRKVAVAEVEVTRKGGVELMHIPEGEFLMGSPPEEADRQEDEGPPRLVKVPAFWMGRYPVTNEQYGRFLMENPQVGMPKFWGDRRFNKAQQPVVGLTWHEASAFAAWAGGRLPSEVEWEYACRAGTAGARYDQDLDAIAWYRKNSGDGLHPVGQKKPNAWGLHDVLGNVHEWCGDWWAGPDPGSHRIIRGGSWASRARYIRAARRSARDPSTAGDVSLGFRIARSEP